jgi:hypothetical protein
MATKTGHTPEEWQAWARGSYQNLPYSWKANFLNQPPMPWYNNNQAQVPPATQGTTPAATNATGQNATGTPGNYSLNFLAGIPQNQFLSAMGQQSPALGGMFGTAFNNVNNAFESNPILKGVGGLLNRLFASRGQ